MPPVYKASAPTLFDGEQSGGFTDINGNLKVSVASAPSAAPLPTSSTATQTSVPSSLTSGQLIAANANRKNLIIQNTSTAILYILYGTGTATATTAHSVQIPANGTWQIPFNWTGAIQGIWAAANGQANMTEFT